MNSLVGILDADGRACQQNVSISVVTSDLGYYLCGWNLIEQALHATVPAACGPDNRAHWNGYFNQQTVWSPPDNFPMWYFTGQSLFGAFYAPPGVAISADKAPLYPGGNWQNLDTFAQLIWDGPVFGWFMMIADICGNVIWEGSGPLTLNDASGEYVNDLSGTSAIPERIYISKVTNTGNLPLNCITACASFPHVEWLCNPGTCRLQIHAFPSGTTWPDCGYFTFVPSLETLWDGKFSGGPASINQYGAYDTGSSAWSLFKTSNRFHLGNSTLHYNLGLNGWQLVIGSAGFPSQFWYGFLAGKNPIGVYNKTADPQCTGTPATFTVEAYTP
jgi:hypothetical protein